jgi:alpha-D-xyloside xylohydrolase
MQRIVWAALLLAVAAGARAGAVTNTEHDGTVAIEAEDFVSNTARSGLAWELTNTVGGYTGDGFMQVFPDNGSNINGAATIVASSPELRYAVIFNTVGTYSFWARGYATTNASDSIHVGLDGVVSGTGSNLTWDPIVNAWHWTNVTFGAAARTISVTSTGLHHVSVWMREDGVRLDRFVLATATGFQARTGNAWHIPKNTEPVTTMRSPFENIASNSAVTIFNGNQFQGAGNAANQLGIGSTIYHKSVTASTWSALSMNFHSEVANNKYFSNAIPSGTYADGDVVQYYLRIPYSDRLPTYLYGNDNGSTATDNEATARADPFSYTVQPPLAPSGGYLAITNTSATGVIEARLYTNAGHLSIVGPDLAGTPLANAIDFAPGSARFGAERHLVGKVLSWFTLTNGLELTQRLGAGAVTSRLTFVADGVARFEVVHWGSLPIEFTYLAATSPASERFYGFGEKFNSFDQSGRNVRMMTDDPPGTKGDRSYKVAPWFMSTRGYGLHVDDSSEMFFDMRATASDRYVVSNLFPSLQFNVVYGPRLTNVLVRYTGYTGRPGLTPQWAWAPWMSTDHWRDGGEVRYVVTKYRERGIPGSVFVFDSPWETAYNDFNWNSNQFADGGTYESAFWPGFTSITNMMHFFRTNGWKIINWMTPFVNTNQVLDEPGITNGYARNYAEGSNLGYFVRSSPGGSPLVVDWWKGRGSPIDFTYPAAAQWLQGQLSNLVAVSGGAIGGFKTDDGESGNPPGSYIPDYASYYDGRTGEQMANGYAAEYHKTVWNVLGTNGILFARSGFVGSQAYPGYWAGDNEPNFGQDNGLASVVVAGQSAAMSAFSIWGHDVGGYQDCCYSSTLTNMFIRWSQFGAFSPLMQMHRQVGSGIQYPWSFGADGLSNYVAYAKLHTALFPFFYTLAHEAASNGLPVIRPLVLIHQDDANTHGLNHTYLLGNDMLVAAIVTNIATTRNVYLPAGTWYDFFTNRSWSGGGNIVWSNTDQRLYPVFLRAGAIVPMISTNVQTLAEPAYIGHTNLTTWDGSLEVLVYPAASSSYRMYDGTTFACSSNDTVVTIGYTSAARRLLFKVNGQQAAGVEVDGVRIASFTNAAMFAASPRGWIYDAARNQTWIKLEHAGGGATISFGPDTVGDGVPNSWRNANFGSPDSTNATSCANCDADGDGMSNYEEWYTGTDPNAATNFLSLSSLAVPSLTWRTRPGIEYKIGWLNDLTNGASWQSVSAVYTGNGTTLNWMDDGADTGTTPGSSPTGRRFYRIIVP